MKRLLYLFFLISITVTSSLIPISAQPLLNDNEVQLIKYGTSYGFCKGYCHRELVINCEKIIVTQIWWQKGRRDTLNFPDKIDTVNIKFTEWQDLLKQIDKQAFLSLPSTIGCPDCDDGGSEWIEISFKDSKRKITFESGKTIDSIHGLINLLRQKKKLYTD
jgi:hypothetical protein